MRAVVQRVKNGRVIVQDRTVGSAGRGLLVYLGVAATDTDEDTRYMADKIANLRVFEDKDGKMNLSVADLHYEVLVVSQFTLYGDARKGRRPSYSNAAPPDRAKDLYEKLIRILADMGIETAQGAFGAHMDVTYTNDGPVTILLDSNKTF